MSKWSRYTELEPIKRLENEGRELIGKVVIYTEKRDGENVSIWIDESDTVRISSHNVEKADDNIQLRMASTPEYQRAIDLLIDEEKYGKKWILYGELLKGISPTRIEPKRKHPHWIMFDMRNMDTGNFADISYLYQMGYNFKIPVVKIIGESSIQSLDHLESEVSGCLKWCRIHRREGIVGKCYGEGIFFKEKVNLPKRPKLPKPKKGEVKLPEMPRDRVIRALKHAFDEMGEENWKNKSVAMPIVIKHLRVEAEEHCFEVPRNGYQYYIETSVEELK